MYSATDDPPLREPGCPIQKSLDLSLFSGSPRLIAAYHVFHRLPVPRHPPCALSSLAINLERLNTQFEQHFPICDCQRTLKTLKNRHVKNEDLCFSILIFSLLSSGGGERDRTDDLLVANQALSQLSYTPIGGPR